MQTITDKLDSFVVSLLEIRLNTILSQMGGNVSLHQEQLDTLKKTNETLSNDLDESVSKMLSLQEEIDILKETNAEVSKTVQEMLENNKPVGEVATKVVYVPPTAQQIETAAEFMLKRKWQIAAEAAAKNVDQLKHIIEVVVEEPEEPACENPEDSAYVIEKPANTKYLNHIYSVPIVEESAKYLNHVDTPRTECESSADTSSDDDNVDTN